MTVSLRLYGGDPSGARGAAADFLRDVGGAEPTVVDERDVDPKRTDPALLFGLASLVLSLPGVALAALDLKDRLRRRRLADRIEELKSRLEEFDTEAELRLDERRSIDLRRASTDAIVDLLSEPE